MSLRRGREPSRTRPADVQGTAPCSQGPPRAGMSPQHGRPLCPGAASCGREGPACARPRPLWIRDWGARGSGVCRGPGTSPHKYQGTTETWGESQVTCEFSTAEGSAPQAHVVRGPTVHGRASRRSRYPVLKPKRDLQCLLQHLDSLEATVTLVPATTATETA